MQIPDFLQSSSGGTMARMVGILHLECDSGNPLLII